MITMVISCVAAVVVFANCADSYRIGAGLGFVYGIVIKFGSVVAGLQLMGLSAVINLLREKRSEE